MSYEQEVVVFHVEWFDQNSFEVKKLVLSYYMTDGTVQLVDHDSKKNFLKRIAYPSLSIAELFIGNSITIYGRLLHLVAYGDLGTKIFFEKLQQKAFILLRPGHMKLIGKVISTVVKAGYFVGGLKSTLLSSSAIKESGVGSTPGVAVALEVVSPVPKDASKLWPELTSVLKGAVGPDALFLAESSERFHAFFFQGDSAPTSAKFENVTLGLIKPHVVKAGKAGQVLTEIVEAGLELSAVEQFHLDFRTTTEFLEVYKDILPHYREMVEHLSDGPIIAIQLAGEGVVERFRELVGPTRVDVAKVLEPTTLRARYGVNEVKNAIHCTDLPEDGTLECRYFFQLLKADA